MRDSNLKLEDYKLLQEYADVFLEEVTRLPTKREINFSIHLVLGEALVFKAPYRMRTPKLMELKLQL